MKISFTWIEKPGALTRLWKLFIGAIVLLVAIDLFISHEDGHLMFETIPGFSAIYGFVACVSLVLIAKVLRKVCKRDRNYYD